MVIIEWDWEKFKNLLVNLNEEEKYELLISIGNISGDINNFEIDSYKKIDRKSQKRIILGKDIDRNTKQRRGQQAFRRELIKNDINHGCRIKHCKISEPSFLTASHILPWKESDEKQKVEIYNGFLLCPTHDFLFDNHLITFKDDGSIIISKDIDHILYEDFNIDKDTKIEVFEENKKYLAKHRETFYEKEKNNC